MDITEIESKLDHGFSLYNPFSEHNYQRVIEAITRDSAKIAAMNTPKFKRRFRSFGVLHSSALRFCLHMLRHAMDESRAFTSDEFRATIGKRAETAWYINKDTGSVCVYSSEYREKDVVEALRAGILIQWNNWKLSKIEFVALEGSHKRTSILGTECFITRDMLYYSLKKVSSDIDMHLDRDNFAANIHTLIVNEYCQHSGWEPAMELLKHHTGDYAGVEHMFNDSIEKERCDIHSMIDRADVKQLSSIIEQYVEYVVQSKGVRYVAELDYSYMPDASRPDTVIVYGVGSCLYYGYRPVGSAVHYYLKIDDVRNVKAFLRGDIDLPFKDLQTLNTVEIIEVVGTMRSLKESA